MPTQVSDALVTVNNVPVAVIPNSVVFTEGLGEQKMRAVSKGGGQTETVYSNDIESHLAKVNFSMPATIEAIEMARQWKVNKDQNLVQIQGRTPEGDLTRTFSRAGLLNNYEVAIGSETDVPIEFMSRPAV